MSRVPEIRASARPCCAQDESLEGPLYKSSCQGRSQGPTLTKWGACFLVWAICTISVPITHPAVHHTGPIATAVVIRWTCRGSRSRGGKNMWIWGKHQTRKPKILWEAWSQTKISLKTIVDISVLVAAAQCQAKFWRAVHLKIIYNGVSKYTLFFFFNFLEQMHLTYFIWFRLIFRRMCFCRSLYRMMEGRWLNAWGEFLLSLNTVLVHIIPQLPQGLVQRWDNQNWKGWAYILLQGFSTVSWHTWHLESLFKCRFWLRREVWGGVGESTFLTSSMERQMLLVCQPHSE